MIFQSYVTVYQRVYLDAKGNNMQFCAGFRSQKVLVMKIYRKKSSRQPGVISPFLPEALGSRRETYSSVPKFNHHPSRPIMVEHWPQLGTHEMMNMLWWNDGFCSPWSYYDDSVHIFSEPQEFHVRALTALSVPFQLVYLPPSKIRPTRLKTSRDSAECMHFLYIGQKRCLLALHGQNWIVKLSGKASDFSPTKIETSHRLQRDFGAAHHHRNSPSHFARRICLIPTGHSQLLQALEFFQACQDFRYLKEEP